jgi:hypothetical protein
MEAAILPQVMVSQDEVFSAIETPEKFSDSVGVAKLKSEIT